MNIRSARWSARIAGWPSACGFTIYGWWLAATRASWSDTSVPTCSVPIGIRRPQWPTCVVVRRQASARHCSINGTWPASATCTKPNCSSSPDSTPGRRPDRSPISTRLVRVGPADTISQPRAPAAVDDRFASAGRAALGLSALGAAVSTVRHRDPARASGHPAAGSRNLVVPDLSAGAIRPIGPRPQSDR